jgi:hypothetical protein
MFYRQNNSYNRSIFHVSECFESLFGGENDVIDRIKQTDKEDKEEDLRFKYCECCGSQNIQEYDVWVEPEEDSYKAEPILSDVRQVCGECRAIQYQKC